MIHPKQAVLGLHPERPPNASGLGPVEAVAMAPRAGLPKKGLPKLPAFV